MPLDVVEDRLARQRHVEQRAGERGEPALRGQHALEPPGHYVGEGQEPQRLARGRAVDDHDVELALLVVALDPEQREELVHPGRDGQLLSRDAVDAALRQEVAQPCLDALPVALHLLLGLDLLAEQVAGDLHRLGAELRLERVGQTVRRVRREHHRAQPGRRAAARARGGDARLADAALARVEDGPWRHERAGL
jgi:hypothetical protein